MQPQDSRSTWSQLGADNTASDEFESLEMRLAELEARLAKTRGKRQVVQVGVFVAFVLLAIFASAIGAGLPLCVGPRWFAIRTALR